MWWWVLLFVLLGAAGVAVIGALCWGLYGKLRRLGRAVAAAQERLAALTTELEKVTAGQGSGSTGPNRWSPPPDGAAHASDRLPPRRMRTASDRRR